MLYAGNSGAARNITIQELMIAVNQSFASAVKANWFNNKNEGISEIDGAFVYTFKNIPIQKDTDLDLFYSDLPSSYVSIPHELGIQMIAFMHSQSQPIIRVPNGFQALSRGLAVGNLECRNGFYVDGARVYYMHVDSQEAEKPVLMRIAVTLDSLEDDTDINIPPDVVDYIIQGVLQKYMPEKAIQQNDANNENAQ
jgi:hypothetical protein